MKLALFDLDNTLLDGDSDYLWGEYMCASGLVDAGEYARGNEDFHEAYRQGTLDIDAYLKFALAPLARYDTAELLKHRAEFVESVIKPLVSQASLDLVEQHRAAGDRLVMITATNSFVTRPISQLFGIDALLASDAGFENGRYTGEAVGIPCFQEGKLRKLEGWLAGEGIDDHTAALAEATFYSDSRNDLPLLSGVGSPVCVDPDPTLRETAETRGWPIISLKLDQ